MDTLDFAPGLKTVTGLTIAILSIVLANKIPASDIEAVVTNAGQIIGAALALYGLIIKIYRNYQAM
jgi:hypothetical protein